MKNRKLILASGSPRRKELLGAMGVEFEVAAVDADESYPASMPAEEVPLFLARKKSLAYSVAENEVVITADTVVILDGEILGKPASRDEALRMLAKLSGRTHKVVTGVCIRSADTMETFSDATSVTFRTLTQSETEYYVDTFRPFDKAGAYGIQEWIGHVGISSIEGSYNNVVGLPTWKLYLSLRCFLQ